MRLDVQEIKDIIKPDYFSINETGKNRQMEESGIGTESASFSPTVHHTNIPTKTEGMEMTLVLL